MPWTTNTAPQKPKLGFTPSHFQQAVFDYAANNYRGGNSLMVQACAGGAKTTTGVAVMSMLPSDIDAQAIAFNSSIAKKLKSELPNANAKTYHALGLSAIRNGVPKVKVDNKKVDAWLRYSTNTEKFLIPSMKKLVSLCKGFLLTNPSDTELSKIAISHNVNLYDEDGSVANKLDIFEATRQGILWSMANPETVDFDDMIFLPNVLPNVFPAYKYEFMFVDEVQDTNQGQLQLAMMSLIDGGMILGMGDPNQSLYRFRGADQEAMNRMSKQLDANWLPLSVSYRCPIAVKEYVNREFPYIDFDVTDWAIDGNISHVQALDVPKKVSAGDMILCRVNADLVKMALLLIRNGISASIKGRELGKTFIYLAKKSRAGNMNDLYKWLSRWKEKELTKAYQLDMRGRTNWVHETYDTMLAIAEGTNSILDFNVRCRELFDDGDKSVVLSTVHRAKGLEADRVFILRPDLMPHPFAKTQEEKREEMNIRYVAVTRTKNELVFIEGEVK